MSFRGYSTELDMNCGVYKPSKAIEELRKMMTVHLILKHKYYDTISNGEKLIEYRDNTDYWRKRILRKVYVVFHKGYTKTTMTFEIKRIEIDEERDLILIYLGEVIK